MPETNPESKVAGLRLLDLAGLVVGYSLAALLVRSFRVEFEPLVIGKGIAVGIVFVWIGLAMSGPVVLLFDARRPRRSPAHPTTHPPGRYSGAEMAWIGIGGYFIALTLFVVPARTRDAPWGLIILTQAIASVIVVCRLAIDRTQRPPGSGEKTRWTKPVASLLLVTWPVAWVALFLVFR